MDGLVSRPAYGLLAALYFQSILFPVEGALLATPRRAADYGQDGELFIEAWSSSK